LSSNKALNLDCKTLARFATG